MAIVEQVDEELRILFFLEDLEVLEDWGIGLPDNLFDPLNLLNNHLAASKNVQPWCLYLFLLFTILTPQWRYFVLNPLPNHLYNIVTKMLIFQDKPNLLLKYNTSGPQMLNLNRKLKIKSQMFDSLKIKHSRILINSNFGLLKDLIPKIYHKIIKHYILISMCQNLTNEIYHSQIIIISF